MIPIYIATEDALSEAVADRLVKEVNQGLQVVVRIGGKGNSFLRKKFSELANTARNIPVLLLTDLDMVACPSTLVANWAGNITIPQGMLFRVVIREIEAWLLSDREGFADFFNVPLAMLPQQPETLNDPKQLLLNFVRRYSKREIKAAILPERGSRAKVGFGYNQMLGHFVEEHWSIEKAMTASESLARTHRKLTVLSDGARV